MQTSTAAQPYPSIRFLGDTETGLVHVVHSSCAEAAEEVFLDLRTAIVRGYRLCRCCERDLRS